MHGRESETVRGGAENIAGEEMNIQQQVAAAIHANHFRFSAIVHHTGLTPGSVRGALAKLQRKGLLEQIDRNNVCGAATWRLTLPLETVMERLNEASEMDCSALMQAWPLPVVRELRP